MRIRNTIAFVPMLLLLAGCAWLGLATPNTFNDKVGAAVTIAASARQTTLTLYQKGVISKTEAARKQGEIDLLREAIDMAEALHKVNPSAGEARIDMIIVQLQTLQSVLDAKKPATDPTGDSA